MSKMDTRVRRNSQLGLVHVNRVRKLAAHGIDEDLIDILRE